MPVAAIGIGLLAILAISMASKRNSRGSSFLQGLSAAERRNPSGGALQSSRPAFMPISIWEGWYAHLWDGLTPEQQQAVRDQYPYRGQGASAGGENLLSAGANVLTQIR